MTTLEKVRAQNEQIQDDRRKLADSAKRVMFYCIAEERRENLRKLIIAIETIEKDLQPEPLLLKDAAVVDESEVINDILLLLVWAAKQLNITESLSNEQYETCATTILYKYKNFRLEDVAIVLRNGVTGEYGDGKIYNRLDIAIISDWMNTYRALLMSQRTLANKAQYEQNLLNSSGSSDDKATEGLAAKLTA